MECEEWSFEDDLKLLDGILHCGYDNWMDIAARLQNKSPLDCKTRYLSKFLINPDHKDLKDIATDCEKLRNQATLCRNCNLAIEPRKINCHSVTQFLEIDDYIRELSDDNRYNPKVGSPKSLKSDEVVNGRIGSCRRPKHFVSNVMSCTSYNAFRSEFDVEYDDKAETILEMLWEPPESLSFNRNEDNLILDELKQALASSYNLRLLERIKRKKIIRNHGLIDMRKTYSMIQRFKVPFGSSNLSSLFPLMKFIKGPELDLLVEKLCYEKEIRNKINSLLTYRSLGIRFLNGIHIYEKLNKKRLRYKEEIGYSGTPLVIESTENRNSRRPSAPLALYNLPGFHLLDEEEKHLCSTARIVPETYYSFKNVLKAECHKHGGLKLAQARQLLKIDVNKTRKMYDYLLSTGDIW